MSQTDQMTDGEFRRNRKNPTAVEIPAAEESTAKVSQAYERHNQNRNRRLDLSNKRRANPPVSLISQSSSGFTTQSGGLNSSDTTTT